MGEQNNSRRWQELRFGSFDGLQLAVRYYPAIAPATPDESNTARPAPLICLPSITGNAKDFHSLALALSSDQTRPRDVYSLDYRGRGRSAHDPAKKYDVRTEMLDTAAFLIAMDLHRVIVLGTSHGGIIAMLLAVHRPAVLQAVVLNDIGPFTEPAGLTRLLSVIAKAPFPNDWDEAREIVKQMHHGQFPKHEADDWDRFARRYYAEEEGLPAPNFDPHLTKDLANKDLIHKSQPLWQEFQALRHLPLLVLRGENSDLLSPQTLVQMGSLHPRMKTHIVLDQGHAPMLEDRETITVIANFLNTTDRR